MVKKIVTYIKSGKTKEALDATLCLCARHKLKMIYNDLVIASNRLHRADKDFLTGLISLPERDTTYVCVTSLLMAFLSEQIKKMSPTKI